MALTIDPADIKQEDLRALMGEAKAALLSGQNLECVERSADAYLKVLADFPLVRKGLDVILASAVVKAGLQEESIRNAPLMWPRRAAKLKLDGDEPEIVFGRRAIGTGEAVEYYEFTINLIHDAETGELLQHERQGAG